MAEANEIRLYRPGDEAGIIRLFNEVFRREMSFQEWKWKYAESNAGKIYSAVAVDGNGEIVGHYGGICLPFVYKGLPARGLAICDVMVKPKFRGRGTLRRLSKPVPTEAVEDGIILGYGFPTRTTLLRPAISLGIYEKVEDILEAKKEAGFVSDSIRYQFKLSPLDYSDQRIDRLWNACKLNFPLAVVRDRRYLIWRYKQHKLFRYELWGLTARFGNTLLGLAVLRRDYERVFIMDFLASRRFIKPLFRKLENTIATGGKTVVTLWTTPGLEEELRRCGFSTGWAPTCLPRTTHEHTLTLEDMKGNFFYTMGDTDFL